jgi:polyketide synthase 13
MTREEIREWLNDWMADHLGISPEEVETDRTLASYGLDTEDLERLASAIAEYFEETLPEDSIRARSTVATLTRLLCELSGADDEDADEAEEPSREIDMDELARDIGLQ